MTIEERIKRHEREDIIYIGQLAEQILASEMGSLLYALTSGRIATEASTAHQVGSAERVLGRIEAYQKLVNDLEQYVVDKDKLLQVHREEEVTNQDYASVPGEPQTSSPKS